MVTKNVRTTTSNAGAVAPKNVVTVLKDAFESYTPNDLWLETKASGDIIKTDGNAAGAGYLVISKDPLTAGSSTSIETNCTFALPLELSLGLHASQRAVGQEFIAEVISTEGVSTNFADLTIASISQSGTVVTITTSLPHGLVPGRRIGIAGVSDSRLNYASTVVATITSPTVFTVIINGQSNLPSVGAGPYTSGYVYDRQAFGDAHDGTALYFESASTTQGAVYVKSNNGDPLSMGTANASHAVTVGNIASTQAINSAYTYSFLPTTEYKLYANLDSVQWSSLAMDSVNESTNLSKRVQIVPSDDKKYKLRIRATNLKGLVVPNAQIVSATKTGTTTATIVTATPHGLTMGDVVNVYGIRDQTNFPNITTANSPASIVDAFTFTIVIGGAVTATSYGGGVSRCQGSVLQVGLVPQSVSTATLTGGILTLVMSGTVTGLQVGDYINLYGVRDNTVGATLGIDGAWKVRNINATTLELEALTGTVVPVDFTVINAGGAALKRTDLRISYVRAFSYDRTRIEMVSRPSGDTSSSLPVVIKSSTSVNQGSKNATVGNGWLINPDNAVITDVSSGAITSTTNSSTITATVSGGAAIFNTTVTAVSGTTPTLDIGVEESDDGGTNWYRIYDFPRITTTGIYRSPPVVLTGNRIRYVQTITGTTPSFTRAINRLTSPFGAPSPFRQIIDRTVNNATLNATTPTLKTNGATNIQLLLSFGAITTTAPAFQIEGSDDNGASWYSIGSPLTAVASSTVQVTNQNLNSELIRVRVSTAGVAATQNYVQLKAYSL